MIASAHRMVLAGLGLILVVNGLALGGVWYNRSGAPDAKLQLTERELAAPYSFWHERENSGLALRLKWDIDNSRPRNDPHNPFWFGGEPDWLDEHKLQALGIRVQSRDPGSGGTWSYFRNVPVNVLLVLELDGPAYRRKIERLCKLAADAPSDREASNSCERAKSSDTRLLVVDAGLDHDVLRRQYPDTQMYAIVHGQIKTAYVAGPAPRVAASIEGLADQEIDVPKALRAAMPTWTTDFRGRFARNAPPFEATVAFGQRLEPWLVSVKTGADADDQPSNAGVLVR